MLVMTVEASKMDHDNEPRISLFNSILKFSWSILSLSDHTAPHPNRYGT
jgi:hypothetical protein